jgi:hypothetical protein
VAVRNVLIDKKQGENDGNGFTKNENKMWKVYSFEFTYVTHAVCVVWITPRHVGRCCSNVIKGYCCVLGNSCTNVLPGDCCATTGFNNETSGPIVENKQLTDMHRRSLKLFLAHATAWTGGFIYARVYLFNDAFPVT